MDWATVKVGDVFQMVRPTYHRNMGANFVVRTLGKHDVGLQCTYAPPGSQFVVGEALEYDKTGDIWQKLAATPVDVRISTHPIGGTEGGANEGRAPLTKPTNPKDAVASMKVPLWLLSPIAKAHWALAQFVGTVKYGAWNWRSSGVRSSIYASAIQRHLDNWMEGQEYDPVDGQHNLGAIMACCAILLDSQHAGNLNDDRAPVVGLTDLYADINARAKAAHDRAVAAGLNPKHITELNKNEPN